ncbi:hypothetical protein B0H17DRAFT_1332249 [Mycena rosella]|uniref:Uncharacterized protein n=1 Tax=Mycena rosella TaxID=1033263 RepID=A0AAD7DCF6_MYCRO|nr:hypothetical protein B0H17DRAFT_1332249 [Mycena rosella]
MTLYGHLSRRDFAALQTARPPEAAPSRTSPVWRITDAGASQTPHAPRSVPASALPSAIPGSLRTPVPQQVHAYAPRALAVRAHTLEVADAARAPALDAKATCMAPSARGLRPNASCPRTDIKYPPLELQRLWALWARLRHPVAPRVNRRPTRRKKEEI